MSKCLRSRNSVGSNTQLELASRFIALANVGNEAKSKYIYALSIAPVDKMRLMDLIQKTTDETLCPYDGLNLMNDVVTKSEVISVNIFRASSSTIDIFFRILQHNFSMIQILLTMMVEIPIKNERDLVSRATENDRNTSLTKVIFTMEQCSFLHLFFLSEKCWFCLSSPSVEKHMVISVGDNFYLALAKGPLDETNILILSVTHIQSASLLSEDDWKELEKFKDALRNYFKGELQTCRR